MKKTAAAVFVILFAAVATAQDNPVHARYIEAGKKQKATEEAALNERLANEKIKEAAIKKAKPTPGNQSANFSTSTDKDGKTTWKFNYTNPKDKDKNLKDTQGRIKEYESALTALKDVEFVTPKLYPLDLKVGQVGIVTVTSGNPVQYEAFQVIDENNVIIKFSGQLHWLKTNTKGMVDGKTYSLDQIVHVKGTRTYKAAIGTKTVLELEEYTPKKGEKK